MTNGPILIDLDGRDLPPVADAAPVPDLDHDLPEGAAMQAAARFANRRPSRLARWFWTLLMAVLGTVASIAAWDFATGLVARVPILGWTLIGLLTALGVVALAIATRELAAFSRLRRVDRIRRDMDQVSAAGDLASARIATSRVVALYHNREDTAWARARLDERMDEVMDADALIELVETELLAPLDVRAQAEVEAAARQVATVTALVPLALADLITALTANLRMIRRIADIYGGRSGAFGGWRLTRAVMAHLVATGAVAVGDDMIGALAGGGLLGKLSRRFGEGLVNGALTARVGVAAMDVCRPMAFSPSRRPKVTAIIKRSLTGLFGSAADQNTPSKD
ncbi:YcjF family protein [Shimia biformata]|uniref:YcjF family protein n=1 Tax=Shimia biformata TaxID=1294299 RepID=UPI00194FB67E|nr:TIGR01620 family protein [Shimia biformata]